RTVFVAEHGEPSQRIVRTFSVPIAVVDVSGLSQERGEHALQQLSAHEAARGFDLARGPLLRVTAVRLSLYRHALLLVMHHIVSDAWSMGILFRELGALYAAFTSGRAAALPEPRVQYADFAAWQRERLRGDVLDRHLTFWRRRLEG